MGVMETHYDNPTLRSDIVDDSGLRLTTELRQYDAGILEAGIAVNHKLVVPPHTDGLWTSGYCSADCFANAAGDTGITVFANFLHAHLAGRALRTRVIRNGTELPPLASDMSYDFDYQEMRALKQEMKLQKGDSLVVECKYETTTRDHVTYGGLGTQDEMCLSFAMYYPRRPLT